jgi:hypothetical protein
MSHLPKIFNLKVSLDETFLPMRKQKIKKNFYFMLRKILYLPWDIFCSFEHHKNCKIFRQKRQKTPEKFAPSVTDEGTKNLIVGPFHIFMASSIIASRKTS